MSLPHLGNAIIINNISRSVAGSEIDVKRLEVYETVGFDIYVYRDPTAQVNPNNLILWCEGAIVNAKCLH